MGRIRILTAFVTSGIRYSLTGSPSYYAWVMSLLAVMGVGAFAYGLQLRDGLVVTGMNDHVSWGLYISNFTFLVGLAAAAVMLVLPTYVLKDTDFSRAVLIGEGVAVAALMMCLQFIVADMGGPARLWHMIPGIGYFNWPSSMLTWDVIALNGYLALNLCIPFYILFKRFSGEQPNHKLYVPFVFLSVLWAFGIHLVTAFLYAGLPARPFWNTSLLGPRFLASAFAGGPAFMIVALMAIHSRLGYSIRRTTIDKLALVVVVAAQVNLVMLFSELFKEFYHPTHHGISAQYLFFGLEGHNQLVPWIWLSITTNVICTLILSIHPLRRNHKVLAVASVCLFIAIWLEKGMGLIIPGFIPSPLGEIVEYTPSAVEWMVTFGIWASGLLIFTILARVAVAIENGRLKISRPMTRERLSERL